MTIQRRLLAEQVELLSNCELGSKIMRGVKPRSLEEFRQLVPVTNYTNYAGYLLEQREDVLPEKPLLWQHTSGRSGEYSYKWAPLTCSIGIASWPNDGVIRDEIIQAANVALYYAKQTGRNRTCLASNVALSQVLRMDTKSENKMTILSTIYALAATVDAKDHHTYGHSKKVSTYSTEMAKALGYSETRIAVIRTAALLHDIGKIGISDRLLEKTGPLTNRDWEFIRTHPTLGVDILKHVDGLKDCLPAVKYHHERYDGKGYPEGLKGEPIPLDARILAVADSYDAMTSTHPYRKGNRTYEQALEEIKRCSGSQFDPTIVEVFSRLEIQPKPKAPVPNHRSVAIHN